MPHQQPCMLILKIENGNLILKTSFNRSGTKVCFLYLKKTLLGTFSYLLFQGCHDIAWQLVHNASRKINLIFGGGRENFQTNITYKDGNRYVYLLYFFELLLRSLFDVLIVGEN